MSIKEFFVGRKKLQPFFERLHRISLRGMNYGLGGMVNSSGEIQLIESVSHRLSKIKPEPKVILDVGANDGQYAKVLLKKFAEKDQIYCFEPSKHAFKELESKLGHKENVHLINQGLGSRKENRKLYFDVEGSGWASVYARKDTGFNHHLTDSEEISIITLDSFCKENQIKEIDFIKADVEGFELEIIKGASEMLPKIKFLQFEFSFANYNSRTYLYEFFEMLSGFKIYRVLKDGLREINYDPRYEILMTTNYLAVNKEYNL